MQAAAEDTFVGALEELLNGWQFKPAICDHILSLVERTSGFYNQRTRRLNLDSEHPALVGWLMPPNVQYLIKQSNEANSTTVYASDML